MSNNDLVNIWSSIGSAFITKTSVAPFERLKVLKQAQLKYGTNNYNSIYSSLIHIKKNEGLKGLYYGNLTNIFRILPAYVLKFSLNDKFKSIFKKSEDDVLDFKRLMYAGMLSGLNTTVICYPFDLIRTEFSLDNKMKKREINFINCGYNIIKNNGLKGLYKGCSIAFISSPGYIASQFAIYQYCKDFVFKENNYNTFLSSVVAGSFAQTIFYPGDVLKRAMMLNNNDYKGIFDCINKIYKKYGFRGIYSGYVVNFCKMIPEVYIQFGTYEFLKKNLNLMIID
tara:strand:- start:1402 stop:2250 length:849 start_codon:yes stop_codon:yes gene_type:complete